jgi:uncharacterized repeat protein (TIGR03803 family)
VWTETVLHDFGGVASDGVNPEGVLIKDSKGAVYGTTYTDGTYNNGVVYKLFQSGGVWNEQILYQFTAGNDGCSPLAGLRWSGSSALYGTTSSCGTYYGGTVFELTESGGVWSETTLHGFGNSSDGLGPDGQVILDKSGNLYGTTLGGGAYGDGTAWEVTP